MTNIIHYELTLCLAAGTEYWPCVTNYKVLKEFVVKFRHLIDEWFERKGHKLVGTYVEPPNPEFGVDDKLVMVLELTEKEYFLMRLSGREQKLIQEAENHIIDLLSRFDRG